MAQKELVIFESEDKAVSLSVPFKEDTVWLNRQQMATLFDRDVKTIGKHINNAIEEELEGFPTVANFATVQTEGDRTVERDIAYYSLDAIISVGYRVKSKRGIEFRKWANSVLKQYCSTCSERTKSGKYVGLDFGHLVELSTIDMFLRKLLLKMTIDLEHYLKVKLVNDCQNNPADDGYEVVQAFLQKVQKAHFGRVV